MRQMAIVIFTIIWLTPSLAFAETKDGFRDMRWGDAPTADFERADSGPSEKSLMGSSEAVRYERSSDKLTIGKVRLNGISYYFEDNKLCEVDVVFGNVVNNEAPSSDFRVIADALKLAYGAPEVNEGMLAMLDPRLPDSISGRGGRFSRWNEGNTMIFLTYLEPTVVLNGGHLLIIIDKAYAERVSRDDDAKKQKEKTSAANSAANDL